MKKTIPFIIASALFMETLDSTIVSTSIPSMAAYFHVSPLSMRAVLTCYLLSLALLIPCSGWLGERFGAKKVFISAIVVFAFGSLLCGFSHHFNMLLAARMLQGIGGAWMMPVGRLILVRSFPKNQLIQATSYMLIPALIGPTLGPFVGGLIVTWFSWHWIFWINIPIAVVGIYFSIKYLPYSKPVIKKFDGLGYLLCAGSMGIFAWIMESTSTQTNSHAHHLLLAIIAILCLILYVFHAKQVKHPLINLRLLRLRSYATGLGGNLMARLGVGGISFLVPLFLQLGLDYTPAASGLIVMFFALGSLTMKFFLKRLLVRMGFRRLLWINSLLIGCALSIFSICGTWTPIWLFMSLLFLLGMLFSLHFGSLNVLSYVDIPDHELSQVTPVMSSVQQFGTSCGISLSAVVLQLFSDHQLLAIHSFHLTFLSLGIWLLAQSVVYCFLKPEDGKAALTQDETK